MGEKTGRPIGRASGRSFVDEGRIMDMHLHGVNATEIAATLSLPERWITRIIKDNLKIWKSESKVDADLCTEYYAVCRSIKRKLRSR